MVNKKYIRELLGNLLVKNFSYLLLNHIVSQLLMFAAYSVLAKQISVESFGKFGFAQAYYTYFLLLLNLGLPLYGIKKFALLENNDARLLLINRLLSLRCFILCAIAVPYILLAKWIAPDRSTFVLIGFFGLSLVAMAVELEWYFRAIQKMQYIAIGNGAKSFLFLSGIYIFVSTDSDLAVIGFIFSGSFWFASLLYFYFSGIFKGLRLQVPGDWIRPMLLESAILGLSMILIQVYYNFAVLALSWFRGDAEAGYYTAIFKLVMFFLTIISLYLKAVFPHMAAMAADLQKLNRFIIKLTRLAFAATILTVIAIGLFAEPIVGLFFGDKYLSAVPAFQILLLLFVVIGTRTLVENSLIIIDRTSRYLFAVCTGAFSNILLGIIFIPYYGLEAAAYCALASEILFSTVAFYFSDIKLLSFIKD